MSDQKVTVLPTHTTRRWRRAAVVGGSVAVLAVVGLTAGQAFAGQGPDYPASDSSTTPTQDATPSPSPSPDPDAPAGGWLADGTSSPVADAIASIGGGTAQVYQNNDESGQHVTGIGYTPAGASEGATVFYFSGSPETFDKLTCDGDEWTTNDPSACTSTTLPDGTTVLNNGEAVFGQRTVDGKVEELDVYAVSDGVTDGAGAALTTDQVDQVLAQVTPAS